jgi:hypothetical protein
MSSASPQTLQPFAYRLSKLAVATQRVRMGEHVVAAARLDIHDLRADVELGEDLVVGGTRRVRGLMNSRAPVSGF